MSSDSTEVLELLSKHLDKHGYKLLDSQRKKYLPDGSCPKGLMCFGVLLETLDGRDDTGIIVIASLSLQINEPHRHVILDVIPNGFFAPRDWELAKGLWMKFRDLIIMNDSRASGRKP